MAETLIRPTMKYIRAGYILAVLITAAAGYESNQLSSWWPMLTAVVLLWPLARHLGRLSTRTVVEGDKLRYETGLFSRSTRTILLSKVQDVRVDQSLGQRVWGVGSISIETAGEASRLTLENIDAPQRIADMISGASQRGTAA